MVVIACDRQGAIGPEPGRSTVGTCEDVRLAVREGFPAVEVMVSVPTIASRAHHEGANFLVDRREVAAQEFFPELRKSSDPLCTSMARLSDPMNCITWHEASEYCKSKGKRLPTEDEWGQVAKRISEQGENPWSVDTDACNYAVLASDEGEGCGTGTAWPALSKHRGITLDGVLNIAGNVSEWTATTEEHGMVVRGGSFRSPPSAGGILERRVVSPDTRDPAIGFRCVAWCK